MTYKHHTRLELVEGGNIFKQGDHPTLKFIAYDSLGNEVDLTNKQIEGALYSRNKGIMYEAPASFTDGRIVFTIDELLDNGKFQLEFTATDSADPDYRAKFPSDEYAAQLTIKPSKDNMDFVGVSMTTVAQLRTEQEQKQQQFELAIVPQVDELKQRVEEGIGAFTEDTEVKDARMDEINLRTFNQKVVAQLADKVTKDEGGVITWAMTAQDIRENITGGNTAVVGVDAVGTINTVNKAMTTPKRTTLGEQAMVIGPQPVKADLMARKIYYSPSGVTHRVYYRNKVYAIPADSTLDFTEKAALGIVAIWFNTATNSVTPLGHAETSAIGEDFILLGYIYANNSNVMSAQLNGGYSFVGDRTKSHEMAAIISRDPVDFDYVTKEIKFTANANSYIFYKGTNHTIPSGTVLSFAPFENSSMAKLLFNTVTRTLYVTDYDTQSPTDSVFVGVIIINSQTVYMNGVYSINGVVPGGGSAVNLKGIGEVKFIGSAPVDINMNERKVVFPETSILMVNGKDYRLTTANSTVNMIETQTLMAIYFNTLNQTFRIGTIRSTGIESTDNEVMVMAIKTNDPIQVTFDGEYIINGKVLKVDEVSHHLEDMIWSWWIYPLATRHIGVRDKTYIGFTDSEGYSGVGSIDNETGMRTKKRLKKDRVDDHNAAAALVMDDGRIMSAYSTGHNSDNKIRVRISSKPENIEEFDEESIISVADGVITYAHLFYKSGKYWLFFRGGQGGDCSYTSSVDGKAWTTPIRLIDYQTTCYPKIVGVSDTEDLRFVITTNPNQSDTSYRLCFFDTATAELKLQDGTVLGTQDVLKDSIPVIVPKETGKTQRLLDVAITERSRTIIAYATYTDTPGTTDIVYKVARYENETLTKADLINAGQPFYSGSNYIGGMAFDYDETALYLSREDAGVWYIEKWQTTDFAVWSMVETLHTSRPGYVAIRPVVELNGDKVIWQEGEYELTDYTKFRTDVKFRKIRDL